MILNEGDGLMNSDAFNSLVMFLDELEQKKKLYPRPSSRKCDDGVGGCARRAVGD
jgi:hypothetical protein